MWKEAKQDWDAFKRAANLTQFNTHEAIGKFLEEKVRQYYTYKQVRTTDLGKSFFAYQVPESVREIRLFSLSGSDFDRNVPCRPPGPFAIYNSKTS